jgi:hypothetical protein
MLDEEDAGKTELLRFHDVIDKVVIAVAVAGWTTARPRTPEKPKFHRSTPPTS